MSFSGNFGFYWSNFQSVLKRSYDINDAILGARVVAVSYDETFFVARKDNGFYQFYTVD
jgi:hypothetical protein